MDRIIGIGEYVVSGDQGDKLRTFALGSCVALTVYCPYKKVMGMVHIALPDSKIMPEKGTALPGYFADTGVPLIIDKVCKGYGCNKGDLVVSIYGGANSVRNIDSFNIGSKNVSKVKKILAGYNINFVFEDTGGTISRTLEADVSSGAVKVETLPLIL